MQSSTKTSTIAYKHLKLKNYKINYNYNDIIMLNHLKYYYYNQFSSLRDKNIIALIKEIDNSFVYNIDLLNI